MATLAYVELWTDLEAAGGARVAAGGFLPVPVLAEDDIGVDGQDRAKAAWPRSLANTANAIRGNVVRFVWDDATWAEWPIHQHQVASGTDDILWQVDLVPPQDRLRRVDVELTDGDGFVYTDVPAFQLTPTTTLKDVILASAPAWFTTGTITPTDLTEVMFSKANALSALVQYAQALGVDYWLTPSASSYAVNLGVRGASATTVRFRGGKNVRQLTTTTGGAQGQQVNRVRAFGADSDDGGHATLGWAYVEVTGVSGSLVSIAPIHGNGPDLIYYNDQFNHASLGYTAYLEKIDGTLTAITDTIAATQQVQVASATGITTGDWVRIAASSGGKHLTTLDSPSDIATDDVQPGDFTSEWDDTFNLIDNPLFVEYTTSPGNPDGYSGGSGTKTKETTSGNWLTGGQSVKIVLIAGTLLSRSKSWRIPKRRSTFSATCWIRPTSLTNGSIGFRLTVGGVAVGEELLYRSPLNQWVQLKIEGLSLAQYEATTKTIGFELRGVLDAGAGSMSGTVYVDSVQISPTQTARPITHGANATRIWQQAIQWLDERRATPVTYALTAVDLARAGMPRTASIEVGGTAILDVEELGIAGLSARILRRRRDLVRDLATEVTIGTVPTLLPKRLAAPKPLVVPFFEPVRALAAGRDTRQAVQSLKATITATTATQVTITLEHSDLLGGSPTISYTTYGSVAYVSGSGTGPYVFTRPTAVSGLGAVIFTSKIAGRSDVIAPVEVPEGDYLDVGGITLFPASDAGAMSARLEGSDPTQSWKYAVSTSSMPSDATVDAATAVNGRSLDLSSLATLAFGDTLYLKAQAFTGTSGGGTPSAYITATYRRDNKSVSKTVRIPYTSFQPADETTAWLYSAFYLAPNTTTAQNYTASVILPKGATVTAVAWTWRRGSTSDVVRLYFLKTDSSGATTIASQDPVTGTGVNTTTISGLSEVIGDYNYVSTVELTGTAGTSVYLLNMEVTYTAPDLVTTL